MPDPAAPAHAVDAERLVIRPAGTSHWSRSLWRFLFGAGTPPASETIFNVFFVSDAGETLARGAILRGVRTVWIAGGLWLLCSAILLHVAISPVVPPADSWRARSWVGTPPERYMFDERVHRFQKYTDAVGRRSFETIPVLIEALNYKDLRYRIEAARALSRMLPDAREQARAAIPALIETLGMSARNEHIQSSMGALGAFGAMAESAVPAPVTVLRRQQPDPIPRLVAARALGDIGPAARGAIPALTDALQDRSPGVRQAARDALRRIER